MSVVFHGGHGVEGTGPWACCPSSPHKGPACSPRWHLTQCLSSSPVGRALCPAIRPVNTYTHAQTHTPPLQWLNWIAAHARQRHPGKADLSLSEISDIQTAVRSHSNVIMAAPSIQSGEADVQRDSLRVETRWSPPLPRFPACNGGGGGGEITFSTGRVCTCIIHQMEINSCRIYRILITSALE